ncbi:hypothetical protein D3C87_1946870 [compost metagenome]
MVNRVFHVVGADRALFQRFQHATTQFVFVEGLANFIAFYYPRHHQFSHFKGGETFITNQTLAATAHLRTITHQARINDFGINGGAERAMHNTS